MIVAEELTVRFRRGRGRQPLLALDGVSLTVRRGDRFGLLGPNGAGKSTTLRTFLGLIRPDGGQVTVLGETPEPGAGCFGRLGYVPEEPHYHLYLTVEEALVYYGSLGGRRPAPEEVDAALERVGMGEHRDLRLARCSKGMKQKTGIAAALLHDPELLILDEPTRGLDPVVVRELRELLLSLNREGVTVVLSSHVLPEVEAVCDRVAILRGGRLVLEDEVANLRHQEAGRYRVEIRTADPAALPGFVEIDEAHDGRVHGLVTEGDLEALFRRAAAAEWEVLHLNIVERSLEESFFAALGGDG